MLILLASLLFFGCSNPVKIEPLPETQILSLEIGISKLADNLLKQLQNKGINDAAFIYNTFVYANSGQTLEMSLDIEKTFLDKAQDFEKFEFLSFKTKNLGKADYIIGGFIRLEKHNLKKDYRVYATIIDIKDKTSVAKGKVWLRKQGLNLKPTKISKDNPMYSTDLKVLVSAITTDVGQKVIAKYFLSLNANAELVEANKLSSLGEYEKAFKICKIIEQKPNGKIGTVYRCLYANAFNSGKFLEAETVFLDWIPVAIKENNGSIPVKIAFEIGSPNFYNEPTSLQHFDIWLKKMAKYLTNNRKKCAYIIGNSSLTSHDIEQKYRNCRLSKKRAISIVDKIQEMSPYIGKRLRAVGKGSEDCKACSTPDGDSNLVDRRVEFKVVSCNSKVWLFKQEKECSVE